MHRFAFAPLMWATNSGTEWLYLSLNSSSCSSPRRSRRCARHNRTWGGPLQSELALRDGRAGPFPAPRSVNEQNSSVDATPRSGVLYCTFKRKEAAAVRAERGRAACPCGPRPFKTRLCGNAAAAPRRWESRPGPAKARPPSRLGGSPASVARPHLQHEVHWDVK